MNNCKRGDSIKQSSEKPDFCPIETLAQQIQWYDGGGSHESGYDAPGEKKSGCFPLMQLKVFRFRVGGSWRGDRNPIVTLSDCVRKTHEVEVESSIVVETCVQFEVRDVDPLHGIQVDSLVRVVGCKGVTGVRQAPPDSPEPEKQSERHYERQCNRNAPIPPDGGSGLGKR